MTTCIILSNINKHIYSKLQKIKSVLFCGLGSIGQRHLRILKKAFAKYRFDIYCYRAKKRNLLINDNLKVKKVRSIEKIYNIKTVTKKDFFSNKRKFDIVFITNPIHLHMSYALKFAEQGSHLFIEKPLSNNLRNLSKLKNIVKKNKIKVCCGYQFRFHPGISLIKNIIKKNRLGRVIGSTFYFGEYLPSMHKYEDYKKTHMAKFNQGGGAVLSLSHQVDLVHYLFGTPKQILKVNSKNSNLKINVDDNLNAILKYKNHFSNLIINFFDFPSNIFLIINFENGSIKWDYNQNYLIFSHNKNFKVRKISFKNYTRNNMFVSQLENFINSIKKNSKLVCDLDEAIETLKLCMKLKKNGPL